MKLLLAVPFLLLLILLIIFLYVRHRFRSSLLLHVSPNTELKKKYPLPVQNVSFTTSDGVPIAAWYLQVEKPKAVVILLHGYVTENGGKALMLPHAQYLFEAGYSTLIPDLRSVGDTPGTMVTLGVKEWKDAEAAYDYATSLPENNGIPVGYLGVSMGGNVAIIASGQTGKGDFVIASVPYASYRSAFSFQIKKDGLYEPVFLPILEYIAGMEFGRDYGLYTPEAVIQNIRKPVLIITAERDGDVDKKDGVLLFQKANEPKEHWHADTAHDVFDEQPEEFKTRVLNFLHSSIY